ncbi:MAG TPA: hypothetical protein VEW45_00510 [Candidatus Dormibacteraeota bacterium]|nr:hypothetical protein [Candidatus Dormibacteraeota bacterium]
MAVRGFYTAHSTSTGGSTTRGANVSSRQREIDLLRAAFRDLHGARLHGFALLVSLGDRPRAARAAAEALAEGIRRSAELRHPERAAAWLRARALESLRQSASQRSETADGERRASLRELGAADAVYDGLAALRIRERAALIATALERFDPIDVETIVGMANGSSRRLAARARERYLRAVATSLSADPLDAMPGAELAARVRAVAERTIGATPSGTR